MYVTIRHLKKTKETQIMSKQHIETLIKAQHAVLTCADNKERLRYTVAGIKDGKFYDHSGTDYGVFDEDAPDTVFIPEADLDLQRITGAKLKSIAGKMTAFFEAYNSNEPAEIDEVIEDEAPAEPAEEAIDMDALEKACKKAIKGEKFGKAQKLIDKMGGHKKLQKKLDKAQ